MVAVLSLCDMGDIHDATIAFSGITACNDIAIGCQGGTVVVHCGCKECSPFGRNIADAGCFAQISHDANGVRVMDIVGFTFQPNGEDMPAHFGEVFLAVVKRDTSGIEPISFNHGETSLLAISPQSGLLAAPVGFIEFFLVRKGHSNGLDVAPGATLLGVVLFLCLFAHFVIADHCFFLLVLYYFICTPVYWKIRYNLYVLGVLIEMCAG